MTQEQKDNAEIHKMVAYKSFKREARITAIRIASQNHAVNTQPTLEEAAEKIYQWLIKDL